VKVKIKAYGAVRRYLKEQGGTAELDLAGQVRVRGLLAVLGVPLVAVWRASINGRLVSQEDLVPDGAEVSLFSLVGGG
jgi:molybdopterin converting factor small subunit